jgi:single-stranded-DNA-specific exonuclease
MSIAVTQVPEKEINVVFAEHHPLIGRLLWTRGITDAAGARRFLTPDYTRDTFDPSLLPGMSAAIERIVRAVAQGEQIAVWADYDCDGIPAAVILTDAFRKIGYDRLITYIPHRVREGFGLNAEGIEQLHEKGVRLMITVDCGTADVENVAVANRLGIDVIITDHHLPGPTLPDAVAIVNPKLPESTYPDDRLCGSGVAFKLACALIRAYGVTEGWEKWMLDMAGLGTVADMVPLLGENRALAHFGLVVMRKSRRPGLQALLRLVRVDQRRLTEDDLSFSVVPRINAASRMGRPEDAFQLLATNDPVAAQPLARHLDAINNERKGSVAAIVKEVKKRLSKRAHSTRAIVIGDPEWKPSLLGLVAQSVSQEYRCPAFVWGREESTVVKGSVRSFGAINIVEVMHATENVFLEAGGHAFSGGFSIEPHRVHLLEPALDGVLAAYPVAEALERTVDAYLSIDEVSLDVYRRLSTLAPFGHSNPKPEFLFSDVLVTGMRPFGKAKEHLELSLAQRSGSIPAIAFFKTPEQFSVAPTPGTRRTIVGSMEYSTYGTGGLRLRIIDVL